MLQEKNVMIQLLQMYSLLSNFLLFECQIIMINGALQNQIKSFFWENVQILIDQFIAQN